MSIKENQPRMLAAIIGWGLFVSIILFLVITMTAPYNDGYIIKIGFARLLAGLFVTNVLLTAFLIKIN
jgi:hypothetical protein